MDQDSPKESRQALDRWCKANPAQLLDVVITLKDSQVETSSLEQWFALETGETVRSIGQNSGLLAATLTGEHVAQLLTVNDIQAVEHDSIQAAF